MFCQINIQFWGRGEGEGKTWRVYLLTSSNKMKLSTPHKNREKLLNN